MKLKQNYTVHDQRRERERERERQKETERGDLSGFFSAEQDGN